MERSSSLGHEEAQLIIQAVQSELISRNKAAVIAVADAYGELVGLLRLDGAPLASITVATNKTWTAARERKTTFEIGRAARDPQNGFDMAFYGDPRYIGWGGGLPIYCKDEVVGAVAVSGLTEQEDEELAKVGIAAFENAMSES